MGLKTKKKRQQLLVLQRGMKMIFSQLVKESLGVFQIPPSPMMGTDESRVPTPAHRRQLGDKARGKKRGIFSLYQEIYLYLKNRLIF